MDDIGVKVMASNPKVNHLLWLFQKQEEQHSNYTYNFVNLDSSSLRQIMHIIQIQEMSPF